MTCKCPITHPTLCFAPFQALLTLMLASLKRRGGCGFGCRWLVCSSVQIHQGTRWGWPDRPHLISMTTSNISWTFWSKILPNSWKVRNQGKKIAKHHSKNDNNWNPLSMCHWHVARRLPMYFVICTWFVMVLNFVYLLYFFYSIYKWRFESRLTLSMAATTSGV